MNSLSPDRWVLEDNWSDLGQRQPLPFIDFQRLHAYRLGRLRQTLRKADCALLVLVNPISLRYAADFRNYALYQSHIPTSYLFVAQEGPLVLHGAYTTSSVVDEIRPGRPLSVFDGGLDLSDAARALARDIVGFLHEIGSDNRRVAVEYVNPSITRALLERGLEVLDGVTLAESARTIKSPDEIACMRWAIAVAELGIGKVREALRPGVSELQLWALMNYTNIVNDGDWHEGRMLASGPRINPWCQDASHRRVESGDLMGMDTDMVGPFGYFADISRTFHCGPATPTRRQRELYRLALAEITHNLGLIRPGISLREFQQAAYVPAEEFHANAYTCVFHGVGMCDEYPRVNPLFRGLTPYDGTLEAGMVLCVESYMGAVGERDGVKIEQQALVTDEGHELLSHFPLETALLD